MSLVPPALHAARRAASTWLIAMALASSCAAEQYEIALDDGSTHRGEVISEESGILHLRALVPSTRGVMRADVALESARIVRRTALPDPERLYTDRARGATDAAGHAALATWCRSQGMDARALEHARIALRSDAAQPDARALMQDLGWVEVDGAWIIETEWLAKQGLERFQGRVMPVTEAEQLRRTEAAAQAQAVAVARARQLLAAVEAVDRQTLALTGKRDGRAAALTTAKQAVSTAEGAAKRAQDAKKAADKAREALNKASDAQRKKPSDNGAKAVAKAQDNLDAKVKAHAQAERDAAVAEAQLPQLKAAVIAIEAEVAAIDRERKAQDGKRKQAKAVADKAVAAAGGITAVTGQVAVPVATPAASDAATPGAAPASAGDDL